MQAITSRGTVLRFTALCFVALLGFESASAGDCGDYVAGKRVPCACGDTVVSDTKLRGDDPVVQERCRLGGLRIAGDPALSSLTLDLAGFGIRGMMAGYGIDVISGGEEGVTILGGAGDKSAQITGFSIGLRATRGQNLRRAERLHLVGNRREGAMIDSRGTILLGLQASKNGGDGLLLRGSGGRVLDLVSRDNAGRGLALSGNGLIAAGLSTGNKGGNVVDKGARNDVSGVRLE